MILLFLKQNLYYDTIYNNKISQFVVILFSATYLKNNKEKYMNKTLKLVKTLSS